MRLVRIAVVGCAHSSLDMIYSAIRNDVAHSRKMPQLLLVNGDFQATRDRDDLDSLSCPPKYRRFGDFKDYYLGKKEAPVLTLFIGGNHESSRYLSLLKFGGFVAKNIYYLGKSNVLWFNGLKIAAISGIFNDRDYMKNDFESFPLNQSHLRSVYHTRKLDYLKLLIYNQLILSNNKINNSINPNDPNDPNDSNNPNKQNTHLDIMLSHDWPQSIEQHGNLNRLLKLKPFFKSDISNNNLGSPLNLNLLKILKPKNWYSAHLHVKFDATFLHSNKNKLLNQNITKNDNEYKRRKLDADTKIENNDEIKLNLLN
ncbi:RNA lariat debranching enzyme ASCRUDRAFT_24306, partial [Ascoidea rubescens DSM 1968]